MKYRVICPIIDFQLQCGSFPNESRSTKKLLGIFKDRKKSVREGIELYNGIKIRPFTKQDITNFKNCVFLAYNGFLNQIFTQAFLLEKVVGDEDERNRKTATEMRKVILALRLFKKGHFFGDDVFFFSFNEGKLKSRSREGAPISSESLGIGYGLDFQKIPNLKKLISRVQRTDFEEHKNLKLACNRFQWAYQEYSYEDRFIDYMIAFETLFLKSKKRTRTKAEPIAIACSELLGNTDDKEKKEIKRTLLTAYSIRNDIVHDREYLGNDDPFEILEEIDGYLRASILKFLD